MNYLPIEPVWLGLLALFLFAVLLLLILLRSFCEGMINVIEDFSAIANEQNAKRKRCLDAQMLGAKERFRDEEQAALQEGDGAASYRPPTAPAD